MNMHESYAGDLSMRIICERHQRNELGESVSITVDAARRAVMILDGKLTVPNARTVIGLIDDMHDELGHGVVISALVDMRKINGAPLRAQAMILKRLLQGRHQIARTAIVSFHGAFETGVVKTVLGMAGLGARSIMCRSVPDALRFLEWPSERYGD